MPWEQDATCLFTLDSFHLDAPLATETEEGPREIREVVKPVERGQSHDPVTLPGRVKRVLEHQTAVEAVLDVCHVLDSHLVSCPSAWMTRSISWSLLKPEGLRRTVPSGAEPIHSWISGAQCRPVRPTMS